MAPALHTVLMEENMVSIGVTELLILGLGLFTIGLATAVVAAYVVRKKQKQ
jgi:ABC-type phosphate transport system permease subunit